MINGVQWLAVAVAGALGAMSRYGLGVLVGPRAFPWTTLAVNVTGSFVLAFVLAGPVAERLSSTATIALTVGFLGAYTTFSTFGYETVTLARDDRLPAAAAYVIASLVVGLAAAAAGYALGRALVD